MYFRLVCAVLQLAICFFAASNAGLAEDPRPFRNWQRHTIDASSRGADGIRLSDFDGDGRLDLAVGWEEGGVIRVYRNPGPQLVKNPWPAVTVGQVSSPEDAVFFDADGDGQLDVLSSCEGKQRSLFVHWSPRNSADRWNPNAWQTETVPVASRRAQWMFALPLTRNAGQPPRVITGSKGPGAAVGLLTAGQNPRNLHTWRWRKLVDAGWIMSLISTDIDQDGQADVLFSDRRGPRRGIWWVRAVRRRPTARGAAAHKSQPENLIAADTPWTVHSVGGHDREVMFLTVADLDGDKRNDILAAVKGAGLLLLRRMPGKTPKWQPFEIPLPPDTGTGKGVAIADFDLDGQADIAFSCENARGQHGVMWLKQRLPRPKPRNNGQQPTLWNGWQARAISGKTLGVKFDLLQVLDLDQDGDLDLLTCEERDNLGVLWYENPSK